MAQSTDIVNAFYGLRSARQTTILELILLEKISSTVWCKLGKLLEHVVAMPVQKMSISLQCSVFFWHNAADAFQGDKSVSNQRIEGWWVFLSKSESD